MINLNKFMNEYTDKNRQFIKQKTEALELFRSKEEQLRTYEEILTELEKVKLDTKIDSFENIKEKLFLFLSDFNTNDISDNVDKVESVIAFLQSKESELKKVSEVFTFIKKTWVAFLKRRGKEDEQTKFMEEINEKIQVLHENFYTSGIDEIGRLEQSADDLKQEVLKVIGLFEELYILTEKNVFIGKESTILKNDIQEFLEKDFYEGSIMELLKRKEKINIDLKEILSNETVYDKKAIPVIKILNKTKQELHFYTLEFDDYILEFQNEEINKENTIIERTHKYLYLDNYPVKGIFKIDEIKEKLNISQDHLKAMERFDASSGRLFYSVSGMLLGGMLLSVFNVINIFMLFFILSVLLPVFYYSFYFLLKQTERKFKVKELFFFIPTNYYFLSVGDINFNYKDVIFNILLRADDTILKNKENKNG